MLEMNNYTNAQTRKENTGYVWHLFLFMFIFLTLLFLYLIYNFLTQEEPSSTVQQLKTQTNYTKRLKDLYAISLALEKYKQDHHSYPISSSGKWDGLYSAFGESKIDWITGLSPKYISKLPRDPRLHHDPTQQYLYTSNGANYKLIAHGAEDCIEVLENTPEFVDPQRNCHAYGFWTKKASDW